MISSIYLEKLETTPEYGAELDSPVFGFNAQPLDIVQEDNEQYLAYLPTATFEIVPQSLEGRVYVPQEWTLLQPSFNFEAVPLDGHVNIPYSADLLPTLFYMRGQELSTQYNIDYTAELGNQEFNFLANDLDVNQELLDTYRARLLVTRFFMEPAPLDANYGHLIELENPQFIIQPVNLSYQAGDDYHAELETTALNLIASDLNAEFTFNYSAELDTPYFHMEPQSINIVAGNNYEITLEPQNFAISPQVIQYFQEVDNTLETASLNLVANDISIDVGALVFELGTADFNFLAQDISYEFAESIQYELETMILHFDPVDLIYGSQYVFRMDTAEFNIQAFNIRRVANQFVYLTGLPNFGMEGNELSFAIDNSNNLDTATFNMAPQSLLRTLNASFELTPDSFAYTPQSIDIEQVISEYRVDLGVPLFSMQAVTMTRVDNYTLRFDTLNGTYGSGGLQVRVNNIEVARVFSDGNHTFNINSGEPTIIEFICVASNDFTGDVDNVNLSRGFSPMILSIEE